MKLSVHCKAHHYLSTSLIHCRCQGSSNKRRSHPLKEEMILALYSFCENSEDNEDDMELDVEKYIKYCPIFGFFSCLLDI